LNNLTLSSYDNFSDLGSGAGFGAGFSLKYLSLNSSVKSPMSIFTS
jgi:hypothetical protein